MEYWYTAPNLLSLNVQNDDKIPCTNGIQIPLKRGGYPTFLFVITLKHFLTHLYVQFDFPLLVP